MGNKPIHQYLIEWGRCKPGKDKPGYVVVLLGANAPTIVHDTIEEAEKEARRLIGSLPATVNQTALVLSITSAVTRMKQHMPPIEVARLPAASHPAILLPSDFKLGVKIGTPSFAPLASAETASEASPAPKFKPGDRVYFIASEFGEKLRVYGTVCAPPTGATTRLVWGNWDDPNLSGKPYGMAPERVFHDLRTVAGGGVLKLEYGRKGRTRSGRVVGPFEPSRSLTWRYRAAGSSFTACGFYSAFATMEGSVAPEMPLDIVELLPEAT